MLSSLMIGVFGMVLGYVVVGAVEAPETSAIPNGCTSCEVKVGWTVGNPCGIAIVTQEASEPPCILDSNCLPLSHCWAWAVVVVPAPAGGSVKVGGGCNNSRVNPPWGNVPGFVGFGFIASTNGMLAPPPGGSNNCTDRHAGTIQVCTNPCPALPCAGACNTSYEIKCVPCEQVAS